MLFLGYDPGGSGTHGVAGIRVSRDGQIVDVACCEVLRDAAAVKEWLIGYPDACALGIDTLLGWSASGSRECDQLLRAAYPQFSGTIIPQNALYSSMTLNGAMVARAALARGLPIYESHPKLIVKTRAAGDAVAGSVLDDHARMKNRHPAGSRAAKEADDKADALLAAWCAAQGWLGRWTTDLFALAGGTDDLDLGAGARLRHYPVRSFGIGDEGPELIEPM